MITLPSADMRSAFKSFVVFLCAFSRSRALLTGCQSGLVKLFVCDRHSATNLRGLRDLGEQETAFLP